MTGRRLQGNLVAVLALLLTVGGACRANALTACSADDIVSQEPNCPAGTGPCTIKKAFTLGNGCSLDFSSRDVTLVNNGRLVSGSNAVTIKAGSFTVAPGGFIDGRGNNPAPDDRGGFVTIQTSGDVAVQKSSLGTGRIDVSGDVAGGTIEFDAGGGVTIAGRLNADSLTSAGDGGCIDVCAEADIVTLKGSTVSANGGTKAGGEVDFAANGRVDLGDQVDLAGSDGGCLNVSSGTDAVVRDVAASGAGVGGTTESGIGGNVCIEGGTDVMLLGSIAVNGTSGGCGGCIDVTSDFGDISVAGVLSSEADLPDMGGDGGAITLTSTGSINVQSTGKLSAITVGSQGNGGMICLDASVDITAAGPMDASGGCGGCIDVCASRHATVNGDLSAAANAYGGFGGMVSATAALTASGNLSIGGAVDVTGGPCNMNNGCGCGGSTFLEGCDVALTSRGSLNAQGPGDGGSNSLTAHEQLMVRGTVDSTANAASASDGTNTFTYPSRKPPTVGVGLVKPDPTPEPKDTCTQAGEAETGLCLNPCPVCGNGTVEFPETCDNNVGTPVGCDGCSAFCQLQNCTDSRVCTLDTCDPLLGCQHLLIAQCTEPPTQTPTITPTATVTSTPTVTPTITVTPSPTLTLTVSPTLAQSPTPTDTPTAAPTITLTSEPTPSATGLAGTTTPTLTVTAGATVNATPTPSASPTAAMAGDANCDGQVTAADLPVVVTVIATNGAPRCGADANGDGVVDPRDLSATIALLMGSGSQP